MNPDHQLRGALLQLSTAVRSVAMSAQGDGTDRYRPSVTGDELREIRAWHDAAYDEVARALPTRVTHLGVDLDIPEQVFPPAPLTVFGESILQEIVPADHVLDMGTGSGVNAILAARVADAVVGVDVNRIAVDAAVANAHRNGVSARTRFLQGDLFEPVANETFDLILFDPPFRWFRPRDLLERAMADENYGTLSRFVHQVRDHLTEDGRVLMFFGTSGDLGYLHRLLDQASLRRDVVAEAQAARNDRTATYYVLRVTTQ